MKNQKATNAINKFLTLLSLAEEQWASIIKYGVNGKPNLSELLPEGFPTIESTSCTRSTGLEEWEPERNEGAKRFAISIYFFLAKYCGIGKIPSSVDMARSLLRRETEEDNDWSEPVIIIEDEQNAEGCNHITAVVYPGVPSRDASGCIIPIATLFSTLNDSMTIYMEMGLQELRKKIILWVVSLNRRCSVDWDRFLGDYPYMGAIAQSIFEMTELVEKDKNNFDIMDSNPVCKITLSAQTNKKVWGYTESDNTSSTKAEAPVKNQEQVPVPYTAFEHYVPGRDI